MVSESSNSALLRLLRGVGANALGKVWVLIFQLVTVPVLIGKWSASGYGLWLMVSAVASYISMSDLGLSSAGGTDMTRHVALGDKPGALQAFQSVWAYITGISLFCGVIAVVLCLVFLNLDVAKNPQTVELFKAGAVLVGYTIIVLQMNVFNMGFRSTGQYALGTVLMDAASPLEGLTVIVVALGGGRYLATATALLLLRAVACICYYVMLRRRVPWIHVGLSNASSQEIRRLAKPAIAALGFPLASALNIQGVVLILGFALSPATVALYSTLRMLSRFPLQIVGIFSRATMPEITTSFFHRDHRRLERLACANLFWAFVINTPAAVAIICFGSDVLKILSHGTLSAPVWLLVLFAAVMVFQTVWNTMASLLFALNLQSTFTYRYAGLSLVLVGICGFATGYAGIGAAVAAGLVVEIIMTAIVSKAWRQATGLTWRDYRRSGIELTCKVKTSVANFLYRAV